MSRTEKTVITIETFQRTVVRTRRASTAGPVEDHSEDEAVRAQDETADRLQRSEESARAAKAGADK